ncbi:MAG: sensor histidine kinase [Nitrosotalea sp.]
MKNDKKPILVGEIHKIRELEQEKILLLGLHDLLNQKYMKMDELCAIVSHEFKTPLVPVKAYLGMILDGKLGKLTKKQEDKLFVVQSNVERLSELITDIIESKKIEMGESKIQKSKVILSTIITNSINIVQNRIKENKIKISYDPNPVAITCDPDRISKVLVNLIQNSLDPSTCSNKIEIHVHDKKNEVDITVRDDGIGIPKDKQKYLFKKFDQIDMSSTREKNGIGLGLFLSKQIVESHGGNLRIESNVGEGTILHVNLPKE